MAKPKPFALSNHFTRAGSKGELAISSGSISAKSLSPAPIGRSAVSIENTSIACIPRSVSDTLSSIAAPSATELWPKLRNTLACSKMSGPPSSATTNPNPLPGSNHFTCPLRTCPFSFFSVIIVDIPGAWPRSNHAHPTPCLHDKSPDIQGPQEEDFSRSVKLWA